MDAAFHYTSPLGGILLTSDGEALTGLRFAEDTPSAESALPVFADVCRWLDLYFRGEMPGFTPPLHLHGTPFQRAVWDLLRAIPYGETVTYGDLARQIAAQRGIAKMSAQAVGGAVGRNPVAIIVPCHRVVGARGEMTGYAFGVERKRKLLAIEAGR